MTKINNRAKTIKLGAKYFAPRAPQPLGMALAEELAAINTGIRRGPSAELTEYFRQANAIRLRVASWAIHELLAHLDEPAVLASNLTLRHAEHWSEQPLTVKLPDNPTFRQLAHAADELIEQSGNLHHRFIEAFRYDPATGVIDLSCGS